MRKPMSTDPRRKLGAFAEGLAASFLESLGYRVLERNWRCRLGEIDLICREAETLVFVEVRARRGTRFGTPEESLDGRKRRRLERLATAYVQSSSWLGAWRIDVVTVRIANNAAPEIRHYPSAFGP
jgi:putative endonuclease